MRKSRQHRHALRGYSIAFDRWVAAGGKYAPASASAHKDACLAELRRYAR